MPQLELAQVSLRDAATGTDITIFDVDPQSYDPFHVPIRGSVHPTLDGGVTHQTFGLNIQDFVLQLSGLIADPLTLRAL